MDDDEIIARVDANYFAAMGTFVASTDHGEIRIKDGMVLAYSGTNVASFNIAFVTRPLEDAGRIISDAIRFFDERNVPFIVRIREAVDPGAEEAAAGCGLRHSDTVPGMALWPPSADERETEGLRIVTVNDHASLEDHRKVVAEAFEMPIELARYFITMRLLKKPDIEAYVGLLDGQAIATSALFMTHRVAGVYNVATRLAYRHRGIGEAMTRHAVQRGAGLGCVMAALQASEMGQAVYERMGFRVVAPYRTWGRPD